VHLFKCHSSCWFIPFTFAAKRSGNIDVHQGTVSGAGSTTIVTTFTDNGVPKAPTHVNTDVGQLFGNLSHAAVAWRAHSWQPNWSNCACTWQLRPRRDLESSSVAPSRAFCRRTGQQLQRNALGSMCQVLRALTTLVINMLAQQAEFLGSASSVSAITTAMLMSSFGTCQWFLRPFKAYGCYVGGGYTICSTVSQFCNRASHTWQTHSCYAHFFQKGDEQVRIV
jgi:hypothetical protein